MSTAEKWTFNEDADGDHAIFSESRKLVAVTVGWENSAASWTKDEDATHARLIAAAPTMLEALKDIDKHWCSDGYASPESAKSKRELHVTTIETWKLIRAAIKLAEGRQ